MNEQNTNMQQVLDEFNKKVDIFRADILECARSLNASPVETCGLLVTTLDFIVGRFPEIASPEFGNVVYEVANVCGYQEAAPDVAAPLAEDVA